MVLKETSRDISSVKKRLCNEGELAPKPKVAAVSHVSQSHYLSQHPELRDTARAMSQENVEILRVAIEDFLAGTSESDREDMLRKLAGVWNAEIELDASDTPVLDINEVYRGRDAVKRFWREWLAAWETNRFEYELVDAGDRVVQLFDLQMRGRSTGIELPFGKVAWVYTFRDGLVIHQKLYMSHAEALKAAGLPE